jgi:hypothetical protein
MALLFLDSFDHYGTADIALKWSATTSGVGTATIAASSGRRSGGALSIARDATVRKDIAGSSTVILGMAMKASAFATVNAIANGIQFLTLAGPSGIHLYITVGPDGAIGVWNRPTSTAVQIGASTGAVLQPNVYAYVEVKATIHATAGAVRVLVNGVSVLNLINQNTLSFDNTLAQVTRLTLSNPGSSISASTALVDDLYLADATGTSNNDFFGDCRVDMVLPSSDGTYHDFTPDSGTVHYSRVNEAVADSLTNVASSTVGAKDSYHFTALSGIVGLVRGVQIVDAALKDDAGTRSIAHLAKQGVSEAFTSAIPLSTDRKLYTTIHETDPATGTAWTQAGINSAEFGVVVAA